MKLKTAVIGVGYLGRFHAQKHAALSKEQPENFELVGVFDLNAEQGGNVAKEVGCQFYSSIDELIKAADVISIATVTKTHYELAKKCLQAGKHVLVEKPMCPDSAQANELVELAKNKKVILTAGHSERFSPVYEKLEALTKELKTPWSSMRFQRYATYKKRGADVSVVHDLMVHDIDLACAILGKPLKIVNVQGGKAISLDDSGTWDWCEATFQFPQTSVTIGSSRLAPEMTRSVRAIHSTLCFEGNFQTGDSILTRFNAQASDEAQLVVAEKSALGKADSLYLETKNFFEAVQAQKAPRITAEASALAVSIADQLLAWKDK